MRLTSFVDRLASNLRNNFRGRVMGFNIYTEMFDQLSAALAGVIATYAGVIGWISGPLRVGVTIYIILLGFAILRGAVEYPFRAFVYRGMKLAALVFAELGRASCRERVCRYV